MVRIISGTAAAALILCMTGTVWVRSEIGFLAWLPGEPGTWNLAYVLVWASLLLTVISGAIYALRAKRAFRAAG